MKINFKNHLSMFDKYNLIYNLELYLKLLFECIMLRKIFNNFIRNLYLIE